MCLRDGGTNSVTLTDGSETTSYTFDYQLPWDGRTRYIYAGSRPFDRSRRLDIGSPEEKHVLSRVFAIAAERFGREKLLGNLLELQRSASGDWFYILGFIELARRENRLMAPN